MAVLSLTCYLKMMWNSQMNGILALKLSTLMIVYCLNVFELCSKEHLIVSLLLSGFVIPVVGFYGIPGMPTILGLLHLLHAPAMAYLRASPNSNLTFVHTKGDCEKWLRCPQCKKYAVPPDQHVGDIFESSTCTAKSVSQWNMKLPNAIADLANRYERGQVSLCGSFSTVVKDAGMSRFSNVQGEVNSLGKLDCHFYGMSGFSLENN